MDKKQYTAPAVKVVTFKVEQGFAGSNDGYSFLKNDDGEFEMNYGNNSSPRNERFDRTIYDESFFD